VRVGDRGEPVRRILDVEGEHQQGSGQERHLIQC
jgi:hypothetical protein